MQKITQCELRDLFGETIPMEVVAVLWNSPPEMTLGEVREKIRDLAGPLEVRIARQTVEALCSDPRVWATHGIPGEPKLIIIREAIVAAIRQYTKTAGTQ